jgi:hypothetical protein
VCVLTLKVAFGAEIRDGEPENAELVELGQDALFERKQRGEQVELGVQTLSMPLRRVRLGLHVFRLYSNAVAKDDKKRGAVSAGSEIGCDRLRSGRAGNTC